MANEFVAKNGLVAQNNSVVSGSLIVTNGITGSLFGTSSQAVSASYTATSSYGFNAISASYAYTASSAVNATSALTASSADNLFVRNTITASAALVNGTITAQTLVVSTISSSVEYSSGSNIFGSSTSNTQTFTGSVNITGSGVFLTNGSFSGSGANLFNIPASGITGLNLSQIATGSVTASVDVATNTFQVVSGSTTLLNLNNSGSLVIGSSQASQIVLRVNRNITGNAIARGVMVDGTIQSDVTNAAHMFSTSPATAASAFTLSTLYNYYASGVSTGSSSTVTNQHGFYAESNMNKATNNYGFYGNVPFQSNAWNLYMNGGASNYLSGSLGVGTTSLTAYSIRANKQMTGNTDAYGIANTTQINSDVTSTGRSFFSQISTQAASFTLPQLMHYWAEQATIGAGSSITTQYGFYAHSSLTGATNNFGFYGNIASGSSNYNLYMNGNAPNYIAGALGIGTTVLTGYSLNITKNITGLTSAYGVRQSGTVQSDVTSDAIGFRNDSNTQASAFTLTNYWHFWARQGSIGAGSAITNQYGYHADSNMVGATNNYGFYGNVGSGSANNWNLYMVGGAPNYMSGSLGINSTAVGAKLQVNNVATVGTGVSSMSALNPIVYVDNGSTANGSIIIKSHNVGSGNVVGALRFVSSPDGVNYNYAGIEALSSASGTAEKLTFKIPSSNSTAATSTEIFRIDINGMAIGTQSTIAGTSLVVGANNGRGAYLNGLIPSSLTTTARYVNTLAQTTASAFTITNIQHYFAEQGTIGSSSAATNQFAFYVDNTLTGATNNYGFYGNLAAASNVWNLYMNGTANNYMAGSLGIGNTGLSGYNLRISINPSAGASYGIMQDGVALSGVTASYHINRTLAQTTAASFTLPELVHYYATQGSFGAGSTVTNQYGFLVSSNLSGATNNFGFYSNMASGWNIYMNGGASNFLSGSTGIGKAPSAGSKLDVSGSTLITGSLSVQGPITGSSILTTGTITAQTLVVNVVSSSIDYSSGSNIFGSTTANTQTFTGSLNLTGSASVLGNASFSGSVVVSGSLFVQSASFDYQQNLSVATGSYQVVASESTSSYYAAFFDYAMYSGSVVRAGTVMTTWSGSTTSYNEHYTADLGGSTSGVQLQTAISGGFVQLQATASSQAWTIRSLVRLI